MLVAGHRGMRVGAPENTMEAFLAAAEAGVDMIETDTHMTKDGVIILMHDHTVDRTTKGSGLIRDLTYEEIRDAGPDVPTLQEFLEGMKRFDRMSYNFELKDYPADDEDWAWRSMRKTIELIEQYGVSERCVVNSFSGKLLEKVDAEYDRRYKLHGFYPLSALGECDRDPMDYLFCACIWGTPAYGVEEWYKTLNEQGIEAWVGAGVRSADDLRRAAMMGAKLVTTDDPVQTLALLREMGLHD